MAQALRVPMIGVSSLDLLAFPVRYSPRLIVAGHRRPAGRGVLRPLPPGARRRAAARATRRSARPTSWPPSCWPPGEEVPAGRRRRPALPRRVRRRSTASSSPTPGSPTRRPRRWCSWPTPGRCARSSSARGSSSRSTCASPTPRSTGSTPATARLMARSRRRRARRRPDARGASSRPMRRRHLRGVLRIEAQVYPRPWSLGLFMGELAPAAQPRLPGGPGRRARWSATPGS